jgi:hypothetical protein
VDNVKKKKATAKEAEAVPSFSTFKSSFDSLLVRHVSLVTLGVDLP